MQKATVKLDPKIIKIFLSMQHWELEWGDSMQYWEL
jgi:hypothetical protein